ncbi:MAG: endonuclease/exonuclease/phosphatase family protein [Bacteroidetes bacterium]|nr:endonuclease/exonuclease/phosphatase family protein [Bacteroidota bacterium]
MKLLNTIILAMGIQLSVAQTYSVMTYNIRLDTPADGVNAWPNRKEKLIGLIRKNNPDILGVQEVLHQQMQDLQTSLPDYAFVGVGRDNGKEKGEYSAIFYKKEKFEVLKQSTFWLSETPDVPGSKSWDAAITRVVTHAELKDKTSGQIFLVLNTHFDHIGKEARLKSTLLIKGFIEGYTHSNKKMPAVITGDFNSEPTEPPYQNMVNGIGIKLYDTRPADSTAGTFCGFTVNAMTCKTIDYIFHSAGWKTESYQVLADHDGTYYPSDHLPVIVKLTLKN